jgi:exopolyphosphatase / guanosine-5'-triphosphate,3'-diphosphate pyrophosphatase
LRNRRDHALAASARVAPRKKVFDVEDPNAGGSPPRGAPDEVLPGGGTTLHAPADADRRVEPTQEGRGAPDSRPHGKKRRKRRRGRKVYARDTAGLAVRPADPGHADHGKISPTSPPNGAAARPSPQPNGVATRSALPASAAQVVQSRPGEPPVFAALDLGTNNCRLLVAVPTRPGQFRVVDAFSRIVRLGEGLSTSGRLNAAAMDRAVEALKVCAEKLAGRRALHARLIATEACRSAANGAEFLARVKAETGLQLEIIDRETEARLAVSGCGSLIDPDTDSVVLFDIGGGSSEVALIDVSGPRSPHLAEHIVAWTSLPVGVVSLAERFGGREVTRQSFDAMVAFVADLLVRFEGRTRLGSLANGSRFHLIGTSGTVTTLAGVHLNLERYDRRRVDGLWMDGKNVDDMIARLLSWDFAARVANPCIGADRADLVLGGCAILEAIRAVWPSERLRVADRGLREGILSELMGAAGVWSRRARQ